MRYESIQYFVGTLFYTQKNKNIKNCVRPKNGKYGCTCAGQSPLHFLQIAKNEAAIAGKICRMLKSIRKFLILFLMDRRFSLGYSVGMMIQIYNSI